MVKYYERYGVDEAEIIIHFYADITKVNTKYNCDLIVRELTSDGNVQWCECETPPLHIYTKNLTEKVGDELARFLNENYPDYDFDNVEVSGYHLQD